MLLLPMRRRRPHAHFGFLHCFERFHLNWVQTRPRLLFDDFQTTWVVSDNASVKKNHRETSWPDIRSWPGKKIEFIDCWRIFRSDVSYKGLQQKDPLWDFSTSSFLLILIALNQIWGSQFKSLNISRSPSKPFEVSVSQSKKLAKKNASHAVLQSLAFTIRHPYYILAIMCITHWRFFSFFAFLGLCLYCEWFDFSNGSKKWTKWYDG